MSEIPYGESVNFEAMPVGVVGVASGFFHKVILLSSASAPIWVDHSRASTYLEDIFVRKVTIHGTGPEKEPIPCLEILRFSGVGTDR